jgi:AraC-like DNA-binding protein
MAVSAQSAKDQSSPAKVHVVDMRGRGHARAGTYGYQGDRLVTGWHRHELHQLEYALHGVVEVETATARYLLPSQQAIWIPAGLEHETTIGTSVRTISVFFDPSMITEANDRARILAVTPLLRELMLHASRWPITRTHPDPVGDRYFRTLADLVCEALDDERPLCLPTSAHPIVAAAMTYTLHHLATATAVTASAAAHVSERTLRRLFETEVGLSWRTYLRQARLLRAMTLLAQPSLAVVEIATLVGFESVSSFTRAFVERCGETPTAYRRRFRSA